MDIRNLVGWAAWGSDGIDNAATAGPGSALIGRRILGHEGDLASHMLLTGTVVGVAFEAHTRAYLVETASGSWYRLGASLHVLAARQPEPTMLLAA